MQVRSPVVATTAVPTASYERQAPFYASAARASHLLGKAGAPRTSDRRSAVRAKKAKTPARSIRYMLSVDRRLKKISLRRISERLKRVKRQRRSLRPKNAAHENSARAKSSMRSPWVIAGAGAICVVTAAALIAARAPARPTDVAREDAPLEASEPQKKKPAQARVATPAPRVAESVAPAALKSTAKSPAVEPVSSGAGTITMTGCLELDDETFWLKDASGGDVPASRSWRSGFLKKRAARIEIVDAAHTLKLQGHVGERVAALVFSRTARCWRGRCDGLPRRAIDARSPTDFDITGAKLVI